MGKARQTFERRQLGLALRRLRQEAGKSQQAAAEHIDKGRTRMVELEDGQGTLTTEDLGKLLDLFEVTAPERQTVLELGVLAKARQKKRTHTDLLPGSFQRFADMEASATEIRCYEPGVIPGLLQAPAYVRAEMTDTDGVWWEASIAEMHERINFRAERQATILDSDQPKDLRFVVAEAALRAAVGDSQVMREQRRHILDLLERKQNLTVQVLPIGTYGHPARGGGLTVFGFGDKGSSVGFAPIVFGPSIYFDNKSDTDAFLRAFDRLQELALSREESIRFIRQIDEE